MTPISCCYCHFPSVIIQHTACLYARFTPSFRDAEELLVERGMEVSYETIRRWVARFGLKNSRHLRSHRPRPHSQWDLDEMFVSMDGKPMYLWHAIDKNGATWAARVRVRRDKGSAPKLTRKLPKKTAFAPRAIVTGKLRSYAAAYGA